MIRRTRSTRSLRSGIGAFLWLGVALVLVPGQGSAQSASAPAPADMRAEVFAGGELERYLRAIHTLGEAPSLPWGIRGFSAQAVEERVSVAPIHPWGERYRLTPPEGSTGLRWGVIAPSVRMWYRSDRPDATVEGPVWAGRGLTTSLVAGVWTEWGPLSLALAPVAFRAENAAFELVPVPGDDDRRFRNPLDPVGIDLPQRFGEEPHQRLDPGNSSLRLDAGPITAGLSTASLTWGPMERFPMLLGNSAGGFPHLFAGTRRPVPLGIGSLHVHYIFGRLGQSEHSPAPEELADRSGTGLVLLFLPRGLTGVEVGLGRFIHRDWATGRAMIERMGQPLDFRLKGRIGEYDATSDNQMASFMGRWAVPGTGFELFGEYLRSDHVVDVRTLAMEPDDLGGHALGFRKGWGLEDGRVLSITGEAFTAQSSHRERGGARPSLRARALLLYRHTPFTQGHTLNGLPLAPAGATAGRGMALRGDLYAPMGRWSLGWERLDMSEDASVTALGVPGLESRTENIVWFGARRFRGNLDLDGRVDLVRALGAGPRSGLHLELAGRYLLP